jgi:hypothetical protein
MVCIVGMQKRVATLLLQAAASLQAGMQEMRVMVAEVKKLLMTQGQPDWSTKDTTTSVSITSPHHLRIARGTIFQGTAQLIRAESGCQMLGTAEHTIDRLGSLHCMRFQGSLSSSVM